MPVDPRVEKSYEHSVEPCRDEITHWLHDVLTKTGDTPSALARRAGLATTTLTRFLNEPGSPMLTLRSIAKLAHAAGVQPIGLPEAQSSKLRGAGMAESEAEPYQPTTDKGIDRAVEALVAGRNAADPWRLKTNALDALGYRAGDIVIVDLNRKSLPGDIVCAQVYQWSAGKAETVFRVLEPPYLIAAPLDPEMAERLRKPLLVDADRVIIKGVVTETLRIARASPKAA